MNPTTASSPHPTDSELQLLKVLWKHSSKGPLSVREVLGHLNSEVGYTTVLKLLQIMLTKGLVTRDESERSHRYRAALPQAATEGGLVGDLLHRLFDGSARQLVQAAIETEHIDAEELGQIERLIRNAKKRSQRTVAAAKKERT